VAELNVKVPISIKAALRSESLRSGESFTFIVSAALSQYLGVSLHTLFQVSTSGATVSGLYATSVSAQALLAHGDFGLGTFEFLDESEMIVLDGQVYKAGIGGTVCEAPLTSLASFAVMTRFNPQLDTYLSAIDDVEDLCRRCDRYRSSNGLFHAFRLDGRFEVVKTCAGRSAAGATRTAEGGNGQDDCVFAHGSGTLVGIWSPEFSTAFGVSGHHFQFISDDRQHGGPLLDCRARKLRLRMEALTDFHLAFPETESYLKADLRLDASVGSRTGRRVFAGESYA